MSAVAVCPKHDPDGYKARAAGRVWCEECASETDKRKGRKPLAEFGIEDIKRLSLVPGDRLVFTVSSRITMDQRDFLLRTLRQELTGVPILVVSDDIDISVLSDA